MLYDFLSAMTLSKINSLFHDSTLFQCNSSNFGIIGNSIAKKCVPQEILERFFHSTSTFIKDLRVFVNIVL